jgi:hypothetical protein
VNRAMWTSRTSRAAEYRSQESSSKPRLPSRRRRPTRTWISCRSSPPPVATSARVTACQRSSAPIKADRRRSGDADHPHRGREERADHEEHAGARPVTLHAGPGVRSSIRSAAQSRVRRISLDRGHRSRRQDRRAGAPLPGAMTSIFPFITPSAARPRWWRRRSSSSASSPRRRASPRRHQRQAHR